MKVTILHEDLNRGLGLVSRGVASRGQLPVLANVLIEATKEGVVLTTTNLEIGLRQEVGGKTVETGEITIPARSLLEFVGSLKGGAVSMATEGDKLRVTSEKMEGVFSGIAASEFPVVPKASGENKIKVSRDIFAKVATQVAYAAASDESRPVLTGIKFSKNEDALVVVATDGFRLSRMQVTKKGEWEKESLILPARTILELAKIVGEGKKEEVEMEVVAENNQVIFSYDKVQLISRVLEGNFPDVQKIIPTEFGTKITADGEELIRAIRATAIFARESANVVAFRITGSVLKVEAKAAQTGESEIEMEIDKEGEDGEIAFNYRYVMEFLNGGGGERVSLKMSGNSAPGVFGWEGNEEILHLIMPVRV